MKRSLLYQVGGDEATDFERLVREVSLAEEFGAESVWIFPSAGDDGRFGGSAPEIWLSGLARRTRRIRLGWGLPDLMPPVEPPMRVAEQAATLDIASDGRVELALLPPEGVLVAEEADWQEGFRMLVDMWDAPRFSWTSTRFEVRPVDIVPKPAQRPHPSLSLAGWSVEHARAAGRGGLGYLDLSGGTAEGVAVHRDAYAAARAEADPEDLVSAHVFAVATDLEPGDQGLERLESWERLGIDHVVVRAGPLAGGHDEAVERVRFLTSAGTRAD